MNEKPLVLIVDDEEPFLEIASLRLHAAGFRTAHARNVPDALAKAERLMPDFVLSDIYMPPGPSGWELALALRRDPAMRTIKFAFFTSLRDPWMELRNGRRAVAEELGRVVFFNKMDDTEKLGQKIANCIAQ